MGFVRPERGTPNSRLGTASFGAMSHLAKRTWSCPVDAEEPAAPGNIWWGPETMPDARMALGHLALFARNGHAAHDVVLLSVRFWHAAVCVRLQVVQLPRCKPCFEDVQRMPLLA